MKNFKIYLVGMLLFSSIHLLYAQEYTYFDVESDNEYFIGLSPKDLTYSDISGKGAGTDGFQVKLKRVFYEIYTPIFREVFGYPYTGDVDILKKTKIAFFARENLKPYYFSITFPANRKDELPELEEKLYRFGKKCMQRDMHAFVEVWDKENFKGTSFMIPLFNFYLYSEGKLNPIFLNY